MNNILISASKCRLLLSVVEKTNKQKKWFLYWTRHFQPTWFGKPHNKHNWEVTRVLLLKEAVRLVYELCVWFIGTAVCLWGTSQESTLSWKPNTEIQSTTLLPEPIHSFSCSFPHSLFLSPCLSLFFSSAHDFCKQLAVASSRVPDHSTPSVKLCNLPISPST